MRGREWEGRLEQDERGVTAVLASRLAGRVKISPHSAAATP